MHYTTSGNRRCKYQNGKSRKSQEFFLDVRLRQVGASVYDPCPSHQRSQMFLVLLYASQLIFNCLAFGCQRRITLTFDSSTKLLKDPFRWVNSGE